MKKLILLLLLLGMGMEASASNFIYVQHSADFKKSLPKGAKIICISPDVLTYAKGKKGRYEKVYFESGFRELFYKNLASAAGLNNIRLEVVSPDNFSGNDLSYFNDFVPLKQEIIESTFSQENSFSQMRNYLKKGIHTKTFDEIPRIAPDFSYLSKQYGTPYFMVCTLYTQPGQSLFYQILVNVETSEIVYREIKHVTQRMNPRNMPPFLYDSFAFMKKK